MRAIVTGPRSASWLEKYQAMVEWLEANSHRLEELDRLRVDQEIQENDE